MWEELRELREKFLATPGLNTEIYRNYIIHLFLYETLKITNNTLPEQEFEEIINTGKRPHSPNGLKAYDLWKAWLFVKEVAEKHQKTEMEFIQTIASKVIKHTGGEITTSVGRYDSSLGDFRLGEDYNETYPLADFRKIPDLLAIAWRKVNTGLNSGNDTETLHLAADFMYEFAHIKPFGEGNIETGLLAMNYIQLYHNNPLLVVFSSERSELLNVLKRGKISQTPEKFEHFIVEQQIKFFKEQLGV